MAGDFSKANRPSRPGSFVHFETAQATPVVPGLSGVVAAIFTADWGPLEIPTLVTSAEQFAAVYGSSTSTQGRRVVRNIFKGEGLPGRGGAAAVLCYRQGGTAAAKAAVSIQNTTPAAALTLTARYEGTRGNALRVTIQDYAADSTKDELILYDGAVELERYQYLDTDVASLVALINANSDWITAAQVITGVKLANQSSTPFTAGNDGLTLVTQDWTDAMTRLEPERFSVLTSELTDGTVLAAMKTWASNLNTAGKRFMITVGGLLDETFATAKSRSQTTLNDPNFVNLGVGSVIDDEFGVLSTAQLAPRLAGIMAQRGEARGLSFARFAGVTLRVGATESEINQAFAAGVTVLGRDSNLQAPVRLEKGLTTWTTTTDSNRPYLIFREPKYVRTMGSLQMQLSDWADANVVGQLPVNATTRNYVKSESEKILAAREAAQVLQPGWSVDIDQDPPPSDTDDYVAMRIGLVFGRSAEQVYFTIGVG